MILPEGQVWLAVSLLKQHLEAQGQKIPVLGNCTHQLGQFYIWNAYLA